MAGPRGVRTGASKRVLLVVGVALLLLGAVLLYVGLKPLAPLMDLFTGGAAAAERHKGWLEDLDAHLGDAALPVGLGLAAVLAAVVVLQMGMAAPKPPPLEDLVRAEVERRMAEGGGPQAHGASQFQPVPVPSPTPIPSPTAVPLPTAPVAAGPPHPPMTAPTPPSLQGVPSSFPAGAPGGAAAVAQGGRRTHCACGSVLVAGGRLCPRGHRQA